MATIKEVDKVFSELPLALYRAEQVRQLDQLAIAAEGIASFTLMRRAGNALLQALLDSYPEPGQLSIFCGTGNNGGDGYVIATLARQKGISVEVVCCGDSTKIQGDALQARQLAQHDGVVFKQLEGFTAAADGVIVDALLGTGLTGEVRADMAVAIDVINQAGLPVVAVDIPSGLCSDTGSSLGKTVYADTTVSLIGLKRGLFTGVGPAYTGAVLFADLAVPSSIYEQLPCDVERLDLRTGAHSLRASLPTRQAVAHKGYFGHLMVTGGDLGMAGATLLASQAACRVGAGLISCATRPQHVPAVVSRCPEIMAHGVVSGQEVEPLLERASVLVVGPGLGQGAWGEQLLQKCLALDIPMVVDADALNLLAAGRVTTKRQRANWILTPHPGEAARLLACSTAEVQADRFAAVTELQRRYGGVAILKGAGTLVADADHNTIGLCPYGNPGMASGGMGDVLSGVLGALLAQGLTLAGAARLGVSLHSGAADIAAEDGPRGMVASDLLAPLRQLVNQ